VSVTSPKLAGNLERVDLVRGLGLWAATAIVIGDTIARAFFLSPATWPGPSAQPRWFCRLDYRRAHRAVWRILLCRTGRGIPQAGGPYVYLNRGLGPLWGFLFGWMTSFLERPVAWPRWRRDFCDSSLPLPGCDRSPVHTPSRRIRLHLHGGPALAALVVAAVTAINY